MKPLENLIHKEQIEMTELTPVLFSSINMLRRYEENPDDVVNEVLEILESTDAEYDVFKDIKNGLLGDYTRERALVLGRNNIKLYIQRIIKKIREEYMELKEAPIAVIDIINVNADAIYSTDRSTQSVTDVTLINTEKVREEYLNIKIKGILEPKINVALEKQQPVNIFLANYLNLMDSLELPHNTLSDTVIRYENIMALYKHTDTGIQEVINNNTPNPRLTESIVPVLDNITEPCKQDYMEPYLLKQISNMSNDTTSGRTDTDLFKDIVLVTNSKLNSTRKDIKDMIDEINKVKINDIDVLLTNIENIIKAYEDGTITLAVLDNIIDVYDVLFRYTMSLTNDVYNTISGVAKTINYTLNIMDEASAINAEILGAARLKER